MHFTDEQTALLKSWVMKKIEDNGDADADILADFALALVSTEESESVARANTLAQLQDFLPKDASRFVDELFEAIATQSYDPSKPKTKVAVALPVTPAGIHSGANGSRKRPYQWESDGCNVLNGHAADGNRPIKQTRRGGRGGLELGRRQVPASAAASAHQQSPRHSPSTNFPTTPQNLPPFDPNDPVAMMAMQQFMSAAFPGLAPQASPRNGMPSQSPQSRRRCRDYDYKGFCAAGVSCPFEHDNGHFVPPAQGIEYDPTNAMLSVMPQLEHGNFSNHSARNTRGNGRGLANSRGGGRVSEFSMRGPSRDNANTSIVVEQIPTDKLEEQAVRDFFSDFGDITEITMHPDRKLAIVKYADKASARAAYESPKVVFDNRFVKVYWYDSCRFEQQNAGASGAQVTVAGDADMQDDEDGFDQEEFESRQAEAQRKHDEAQKQRLEAQEKRAELDRKMRHIEAERSKMNQVLAKKSGKIGTPTQNGGESDSPQVIALRAQLAKVEAEAKALGIDPDAPLTNGHDSFSPTSYRGRGGYRGRGRGRGYHQSYRGGWAGGASRAGAVMRLDNRPKTVAITFGNDNSYDANDEALRQFLLFNSMDTAAIAQHPEKENTSLITFSQRFEGENFMAAAGTHIPHAGKVETGWYAGVPPAGDGQQSNGTSGAHRNGDAVVRIERASSEPEDREMDDGEREEQDLDRFA